MAKPPAGKKSAELITLDQIKRLAIAAMFSDDELMDQLVLKGGNAMALIHKLTSRESVDLDFSMRDDFPDGTAAVQRRIEAALQRTFRTAGYEPFDFKMEDKPASVSPDLAGFWGGYAFEFKLVPSAQYAEQKDDLPRMQRSALNIGQARRFFIEISRFEYIDDKEEDELEGYRIYVYSPLMIACEKLRAICQQMPEYSPVVRRSRPPTERARDFLDIHTLVEQRQLDLLTPKALDITRQMFELKHVELEWLGIINNYREFHRQGFQAVQATVSRGFDLREFDFYVDYVVKLASDVLAALRAAEPA
ncbi:MAG TPA: nucleotidyl transferase AbiEii/AbiGii toxin family protein [Burkholderiaceae bacterium]|nr:nucleotidyl transferase AbiEii/AbiGii toxin family protein [Burkholderiaceae bacterium]